MPEGLGSPGWKISPQTGLGLEWVFALQGDDIGVVVRELRSQVEAAKKDLLSGTERETTSLQERLKSITDLSKIEKLYEEYYEKLDEKFQKFKKVKKRLASLLQKITELRENSQSCVDKSLKKCDVKSKENSDHAPQKEELSSTTEKMEISRENPQSGIDKSFEKHNVKSDEISEHALQKEELSSTTRKMEINRENSQSCIDKSFEKHNVKSDDTSEHAPQKEELSSTTKKIQIQNNDITQQRISESRAIQKNLLNLIELLIRLRETKNEILAAKTLDAVKEMNSCNAILVPNQTGSANGEPIETAEHEKAQSRVESIDETLKGNLKRKARKRRTIGSGGGEMELHGCKVTFPKNAVKKPTIFELSVDNNPENFPKKGFPITPILGVEPPITFSKQVTAKMRTCYSASEGKEIRAQILRKEDEGDWQPGEKVTLSHRNEVTFKVWHFSDRVVVVGKESSEDGEYHIFNDVYIKPRTATILSVFCMDQKSQSDSWDTMKGSDYVKALPLHEEIIVAPQSTVQVSVKCEEPEDITYQGPKGNPSSVKITSNFRRKQHIKRYFHPEKFPADYEGTFRADYHVKKEQDISETDEDDDDENICASLIVSWPMQTASAATGGQTFNLTAAFNSADHGAEQSITENNTRKRMKMTSTMSPRN